MRRLAWTLAVSLIFAACAGGGGGATTTAAGGVTTTTAAPGTTAPTPTGGEAPIRIGVSLPLTGEFSIPGSKHRDGYQYCIDEINARGGLLGRQVELLVEDNRSDTEVAVSQYERFISAQQVDLLFGTFSSLLTFPVSAVAEQAGMVYPVPSGGALRIWERGFQNIFYFQQTAVEETGVAPVGMLEYYRDQGVIPEDQFPTTAAVVYADDFFAAAIANGLLGGEVTIPDSDKVISLAPGYLAEAGIEAVFVEQWPIGFTDWLTLANSIRNSGAEMVMATTASPDEAVSLVNALRTVGVQPSVMYTSQGTQSEFYDALGEAAEGIVIQSSWHPRADWEGLLAGEPFSNSDFIEGFTAAFGRAPDEDEAIPFAVCQGMEQAVRGVGSTDNAAMRQWLHDRTPEDPVKTILGDFYWDERGLPFDRFQLMTQWQNGNLEFVFPVGEFPGTVDLVFPKPAW
ncbi:MAG: branched-chain amino acid ABC transporter substrate-binding protein [Acidimicrobiia bacterium]|nr:MAG: branched-chain amino acid ABC transporter substrate-binding protein [Acidimicrobiia bacterium]